MSFRRQGNSHKAAMTASRTSLSVWVPCALTAVHRFSSEAQLFSPQHATSFLPNCVSPHPLHTQSTPQADVIIALRVSAAFQQQQKPCPPPLQPSPT